LWGLLGNCPQRQGGTNIEKPSKDFSKNKKRAEGRGGKKFFFEV